jgi:hypothetical protein
VFPSVVEGEPALSIAHRLTASRARSSGSVTHSLDFRHKVAIALKKGLELISILLALFGASLLMTSAFLELAHLVSVDPAGFAEANRLHAPLAPTEDVRRMRCPRFPVVAEPPGHCGPQQLARLTLD